MLKKFLNFLNLAKNTEENEIIHVPKELEKVKVSNILNSNLFMDDNRNKFKEWIHSYLNESENLTEKKYKLLFINLYFKNQLLYLNSILGEENTLISDISKQIIENKESSFDFELLFKKSSIQSLCTPYINSKKTDNTFKVTNLKNILDEDNNNSDKLKVAKKIYEEFTQIGILGKTIIDNWEGSEDWEITKFFANMQNFKLNSSDIENFKEDLSKEFKKDGEPNFNRTRIPAYKGIDLLNDLIMNEDKLDSLYTLKQFYFNNTNLGKKWYDSPRLREKALDFNLSLQKILNKKIEYLDFQKELSTTAFNTSPKTKKLKI